MHQRNEVQFETVMHAELNCMTVYQNTGRMPESLSSSLYQKIKLNVLLSIHSIHLLAFIAFDDYVLSRLFSLTDTYHLLQSEVALHGIRLYITYRACIWHI